ncbi:basic proline-rich protein-like [Falco rusticolus]|uniref:basic proline-rich protein-like n=1 Tax=Falco rusticolus TaxID=120794 RepID=UPI00188670C9|nr:basic proline-rich protein-like [Falco rusticolus]
MSCLLTSRSSSCPFEADRAAERETFGFESGKAPAWARVRRRQRRRGSHLGVPRPGVKVEEHRAAAATAAQGTRGSATRGAAPAAGPRPHPPPPGRAVRSPEPPWGRGGEGGAPPPAARPARRLPAWPKPPLGPPGPPVTERSLRAPAPPRGRPAAGVGFSAPGGRNKRHQVERPPWPPPGLRPAAVAGGKRGGDGVPGAARRGASPRITRGNGIKRGSAPPAGCPPGSAAPRLSPPGEGAAVPGASLPAASLRCRPPARSRPRRPAGGSRSPQRGARRGGRHPQPLPPGPIVRRAVLTVRGAGAARAPAGSPRCGWCRGSRAWPPEVRAIKSSAGRRRRRRRQEWWRRGEEDSGGLAGAGSPCPALQPRKPPRPGTEEKGDRRRRRPGSCCRPQTGRAGTGRRSPRCRGCTSPNPAPSRRGSRRREEAAESPLQRSQAAARHGRSARLCRRRKERGARLGRGARPQVPGQPAAGRGEEQRPPPCAAAVPGGVRLPAPSSSSSRAPEGACSAQVAAASGKG